MAFLRVRFGLGLVVALGCALASANAQAPEPTVILVPSTSGEVVVPYGDAKPAAPGIRLGAWPLSHSNAAADANSAPVRSKLNQCGYWCKSNINWYGCGGIRSELQFVFGSCRTFFTEPCFPPNGLENRQGNGTAGNCPHCDR